MVLRKISSIVPLLFFVLTLNAQMPVLKVKQAFNQELDKVSLSKLAIDVQITGNIATTVMTMTFYNSSNRVLEGELTFPMPEGVTVSRYALDINGKMREAVPVEKTKAKEVFETIVRQRVDPGLIEKVEGNNFRTQIYPLPAKGSRTIIVGYEEELSLNQTALKYHLPLDYPEAINSFSLKATVFESVIKPEITEQPDGSFNLEGKGNTYLAELKKTNYKPSRGLTISLPKRSNLPELQMQKATGAYYFLVNVFPEKQSRPKVWANTIGLIWDVSLSASQRDIKKEIELLSLIIKQKQNLTIKLGLLNNRFVDGGTFVISNGNWQALKNKLQDLILDGGTNFSAINTKTLAADEYLLFSDGLSTFGKNTVALNKPVYTINSALKADYSTLKYISLKSGGKFVNLNNLTAYTAFEQLNVEHLKFLGIKNNTDIRQVYPSMPVDVDGHLSLAGILNGLNTEFTIQFGFGNTVTTEQKVRLNATEQSLSSVNVSRIWAQKKIAEMDIQYEQNKEDISVLSKQFGLVTRNTSLIVLENLSDYLRYEITPPAELSEEYNQVLKQRRQELVAQKQNLINAAVAMAKDLKAWWNTDFSNKETTGAKGYPEVADRAYFPPQAISNASPARAPAAEQRMETASASAVLNEMVVVSTSNKQRKMMAGSASMAMQDKVSGLNISGTKEAQPLITVKEFKSDKDYMKVLTGSSDSAYQAYLKVKPAYISTPMFYFDVANWFYQQKDSVRALTILSNIADLDLENADLYKTIAYKLKETGNNKDQIFITQKILQWRPMDAQSYRDYALALADDGQYQQALDYLYKVLTKSYNTQIASRDQGIEEIVISEINNLITRHGKRLNTSGIDKRIIASIPVDVRVVLNWNKNDTDIDLWVTDPNGEKCFYSAPRTKIGGRISKDFTAGYGPEQFMLKKAIKGSYKIEVNYYGDRQVSISGPTTVSAEIYTLYGNGKEKRKMIVLPLNAADRKGNLVGEFNF